MVRVVALFVAVTLFLASPAFAQSFKSTSSHAQPPSARIDLSAKAAGIDTMATAPDAVKKPAAASAAGTRAQIKKSFWKTPWPYVIGVAVIAIVAIAYSGDGSGY
jgi:hypothetical protein